MGVVEHAGLNSRESLFLAGSSEILLLLAEDGRCLRVVVGGAAPKVVDFERWLGRRVVDLVTNETRHKLTGALHRQRTSMSHGPVHFEVTVTPDPAIGTTARLFDATLVSKADAQVLALRDVTEPSEARNLEARLAHDEMLEALGILTGSIAHDFNNILVSIISTAELARKTSAEGRLNDYVDAIVSAVNRGRDLTRSLASFAKGGESTFQPVELAPLIEETARTLRALDPERTVIVTMPAAKARVHGDASQIYRALLNVGKNAIEAVRDDADATIELSLERFDTVSPDPNFALPAGSFALIRVVDQGCGMDEATMACVFDPFFTRKVAGDAAGVSGLGMSVVHGIVRAHGGGVRVTSTAGEGTSCAIALPLLDMGEELSRSTQSNTNVGARSARLLVVDDDPNVGRSLVLLLESLGHEVVLERNALSAIDLVRTAEPPFDLVLTDLSMPTLDGIALATRLASLDHERCRAVVLVSGGEIPLAQNVLHRARIAAILPKPFTLKDLERTLASLLPRDAARAST